MPSTASLSARAASMSACATPLLPLAAGIAAGWSGPTDARPRDTCPGDSCLTDAGPIDAGPIDELAETAFAMVISQLC